ncbi:Uncharacterised protein [Avibacterium paragallinarum]|uniref:Uncharacterized protein n=1 Tax=Avibacterium paragallinarum TaxID=728 RepID=A0A377IUB6_AVIPA|nr:hypothetical protein [Avibacterium paragallinarum]STO91861.1 Uncharacterised protein [Avibacterium paragallinarum]
MSNQKSSQSKPQPAPTKPTQTVYRKPEPVLLVIVQISQDLKESQS